MRSHIRPCATKYCSRKSSVGTIGPASPYGRKRVSTRNTNSPSISRFSVRVMRRASRLSESIASASGSSQMNTTSMSDEAFNSCAPSLPIATVEKPNSGSRVPKIS